MVTWHCNSSTGGLLKTTLYWTEFRGQNIWISISARSGEENSLAYLFKAIKSAYNNRSCFQCVLTRLVHKLIKSGHCTQMSTSSTKNRTRESIAVADKRFHSDFGSVSVIYTLLQDLNRSRNSLSKQSLQWIPTRTLRALSTSGQSGVTSTVQETASTANKTEGGTYDWIEIR
jgi:hypothetical protein